jgi:hypothetical protein
MTPNERSPYRGGRAGGRPGAPRVLKLTPTEIQQFIKYWNDGVPAEQMRVKFHGTWRSMRDIAGNLRKQGYALAYRTADGTTYIRKGPEHAQ